MKRFLSLLDYLAAGAGIQSLSDMHYMSIESKRKVLGVINRVEDDEFSLVQWNDAVTYIADGTPCTDIMSARMTLTAYLLHK